MEYVVEHLDEGPADRDHDGGDAQAGNHKLGKWSMGSQRAKFAELDGPSTKRGQMHEPEGESDEVDGYGSLSESAHGAHRGGARPTDNLQLLYKLKDFKMKQLVVPLIDEGPTNAVDHA